MSVIAKTVFVALLSFAVTMLVMALASRGPGMAVPLRWWIIGGLLPLVISVPVSFTLARQAESVRRLNTELQAAYAALQRAAETDHLTGIDNRQAFGERVAALHLQRAGWFLAVDIDHFKAINDSNSHGHGDAALIAVAQALRAAAGGDAIVGRIGGDEFGVFLPASTAEKALATADAIRVAAAGPVITGADGSHIALTVSIGVADGTGVDVAEGLAMADRAMYAAKQAGRNRVYLHG